MLKDTFISRCSSHPKPLWPGLWVSWPTKALQALGVTPWPHANPHDLFGLESSWAWVKAVSLQGSESQQILPSRQICFWEQTWTLCRCCLWVTSSPSPFYTLSPKVATLRRLLWKDIIILFPPHYPCSQHLHLIVRSCLPIILFLI